MLVALAGARIAVCTSALKSQRCMRNHNTPEQTSQQEKGRQVLQQKMK